ncbi:MAG TPA: UvrD-helicase domain-containing protein [Allosphingosinicella sp.]|jgi:superfamily I DNA/RNA helicase
MDAVQLARQAAAQLHDELVSEGFNPSDPYAFAAAEAARRDIEVTGLSPGATMLDSARARLGATGSDRFIVHENIGSRFEQAFLVAHELGHAHLGDDPLGETAAAIDPLRSSEPSPLGFDRVVDYGRRQRREIQMDLFARELLLPRHVVRRLHVDEGMSASDIAKQFGAPFDVVAQQLFDALLLPIARPTVEAPRPDKPLNPEQAAAADHRGKPYLLEAGPGTGKTQTLVGRVESLLRDTPAIDPRRILVLTFSNKAAGEMAERIARKNPQAAAAMWIGTFHAFGLDIIRRFHAELGLTKDPRMMDRTEAVELLENEFPKLELVHYRNLYDPTQQIADILSAISRAKDEVVGPARYAELAKAMRVNAVTPEDIEAAERALEVAKVYARYEQLKAAAKAVDFGDLVSLPVQLLEGQPEIEEHLQQQYDHILVDEYQDVNHSSIRLVSALRTNGHNLWAVGDAKQSIYRFRGASSFNMPRFDTEDFPGAERQPLKINYRSCDEVVEAYSAFAAADMIAASPGSTHLEADRGPGGLVPEFLTVEGADQQSVALAESIEAITKAGHSYRDQAVLCTGNDKLSRIGQDLERLGIPVLFLGSLFEREEVKDLLALLSVLTDGRAMGLVRLGCWPDFPMSIDDVAAVLDHLRVSDAAPLQWREDIQRIPGLSEEGRRALHDLSHALDAFDSSSRPWDVLASTLLDRSRRAATISSSEAVTDQARGIAIWQFLNFVRAQPPGAGLPITRLLDRVRRLVRLMDERDLRQIPAAAQGLNAVRLMTIHGAKGLEFPVVHLPGMNADSMPGWPKPPACLPPVGMIAGAKGTPLEYFKQGHAEEQECLFYVALSRAKDRLTLYAPTKNAGGAKRATSPFIERLGSRIAKRNVVVTRQLPPAPGEANLVLQIDGGLRFSGSQITLYDSCARRFFYTYILQIGGRRTMTAFMHMHEAVRRVTEAIIKNPNLIECDADVDRLVVDSCNEGELATHGYAADYHELAKTMVRYFLTSRESHSTETPSVLRIAFGAEEIYVRPDDVLVDAQGARKLRRVRTGHLRSAEHEDVGAAAFILAARATFPDAVVELVHLSDQTTTPLDLTSKKLEGRRTKLTKFLAHIRSGHFPADPSYRTCPGCPAFFICGTTPAGTLHKKF